MVLDYIHCIAGGEGFVLIYESFISKSCVIVRKQITASQYSEVVPEIMKQSKGFVHSVFNSSFNLQYGERLVHIGPIENGIAPFGIGLRNQMAIELTRLVKKQEEVEWDSITKRLSFENNVILNLEFAKKNNIYLKQYEVDFSQLHKNKIKMIDLIIQFGWVGGLFKDKAQQEAILDYIKDESTSTNLEFSELNQKIIKLLVLVKKNTEFNETELFDYWIGRGPGLTPSGDDIMTGICIGLNIVKNDSSLFTKQLKAYLLDKGLKRTTPVAYEYLLYALEGGYHSSILRMGEASIQNDDENLKYRLLEMEKIGHTSGIDTLLGILIGLSSESNLK